MNIYCKRRSIALLLSFAFLNVVFFSVINLHQNRIFDKERIVFDEYLIKKDEEYLEELSSPEESFDSDDDSNFSTLYKTKNIDCYSFTDFTLIYTFVTEGLQSGINPSALPIRGSPLA